MFSDPSTFLSLWTKSEKMKERQRIESNSSKRMLDVNSLLERKQTLIEYKSKFGVTGQDSGDLNSEKHGKLKYGMDEQDGTKMINPDNAFEGIFLHFLFMNSSIFMKDRLSLDDSFKGRDYMEYIQENMVRLDAGERTVDDMNGFQYFRESKKNEQSDQSAGDTYEDNMVKSRNKPVKYLRIGYQEFELGLDILGKDRTLHTSHTFIYN